MQISTYKSLLTNKKTRVVVSIGKCGYRGYRESQIQVTKGEYIVTITDGYKVISECYYPYTKGLKTIINLVEGKMKLS